MRPPGGRPAWPDPVYAPSAALRPAFRYRGIPCVAFRRWGMHPVNVYEP